MKSFMRRSAIILSFIVLLFSCAQPEKKIAIVTLMQHPVLDSVASQTKSYLLQNGYDQQHGYIIVEKNLNGQKEILGSVVNEIQSQKPVAIVAITTPVAQAFSKNNTIPLVFSLVTDPIEAGILDSLTQTKPQLTGTSDVFPFEEQLKLIREIHPDAKTIGIVFDPGEAPARFAMNQLTRLCPKYGFQLISKAATSTTEMPLAAKSLIGKADIFFVSSDNTAIEAVPTLVSLCAKNKIPLYAGETGSVEKGAIATCSVSYGSFGRETGKLVDRLLKGEKNIPIYMPSEYEIVINKKAAEMMNVTVPESVLKKAKTVYSTIKFK